MILHVPTVSHPIQVSNFFLESCSTRPVCAMYAKQLHHGEEIGLGDFHFLPEDKQQAWKLPIELMIDLPHLRTLHPVWPNTLVLARFSLVLV